MEAAAWRTAPIHCRRLIEFLMIEHCNHAGRENGRLQATYDQLTRFGIPRKRIATAIREGESRGLIEVTRRGGLYGAHSRRTTSHYRLTWIGCIDPQRPATNEWRRCEQKFVRPVTRAGTVRPPKKIQQAA
jgi:hypothetical protein